jgi:hypothetical protein
MCQSWHEISSLQVKDGAVMFLYNFYTYHHFEMLMSQGSSMPASSQLAALIFHSGGTCHMTCFITKSLVFRHAIHKRRKPKYGPETVMSSVNLNSVNSVHDFHRFAIHHNGVSPVLHFHLAGSINPETGIQAMLTQFLTYYYFHIIPFLHICYNL